MGFRLPSRLVAMLTAAALLTAACSSAGGDSATPGVTDTKVIIGSHQPLTGPASAGYSEIPQASNAYFQYVNDHGGVHGRKIVYKYEDDGYDPTKTVDVVKKLVLQDQVFAIFNGFGTPTHSKVLDFLNSRRVPDLFPASGCTCWNQPDKYPYTFAWQPNYVVEGKILGNYIKENFPNAKVGVFYQNDDFGEDGMKGLDKYISNQIVSRQSYEPGSTDVGPAVSALQRNGAQVIVGFTIPAYTALLRLGMLKLGYDAHLVISNVGSDPTTLVTLLESFAKSGGAKVDGNPLTQGILTSGYVPSANELDNPWIADFKKIHDKYLPNLPFDNYVVYGMAVAYAFTQVLEATGRDLTRENLIKTMESHPEFTGPTVVPYGWTQDSHAGMSGIQMGKIEGNGVAEIGLPPQITDSKDAPIRPYDTKPPAPPANAIPQS
jgi:ABC-type branched-subunit amino acid transport system substrate-binding protein